MRAAMVKRVSRGPRVYYARDPLWSNVAAMRAGRLHLSPGVPFGWADLPPSINRLIGLRWPACALYPSDSPEDLHGAVQDF